MRDKIELHELQSWDYLEHQRAADAAILSAVKMQVRHTVIN